MEGYIFSVNPNKIFMGGGPMGRFHATPPKPGEDYGVTVIPDKPYSVVVPGSHNDMTDGPTLEQKVVEGKEIARDLVAQEQSRGVFVVAGEKPTRREIEAARATLIANFESVFRQTDALWQRTHDLRLVTSDASHAARYLHSIGRLPAVPPWAEHSVQHDMTNCLFCGTTIRRSFPKCPNCNEVNDQKAYAALRATAGVGTRDLSSIKDTARPIA